MAIHSFLAAGILLFAVLLYQYIVQPLWRNPLSKIPSAHWSSGSSCLWILWQRYRGTELEAVHAAHRRLGSIVRVGPSDISVSNYETGVRPVYHGGFPKPPYFSFFEYYGTINSFASQSKANHSACRRGTSIVYSKTALYRSDQLASLTRQILAQRLVPALDDASRNKRPTELLRLSYALSLDLISCFIFGLRTGSNFMQDRPLLESFLGHYENRFCQEGFWPQEVPGLTRALGHLGIDMLPSCHHDSKTWLEDWMMGHVDKAEETCRSIDRGEGDPEDPADIPVVYAQQRRAMKLEGKGMLVGPAKRALASELFDHLSGAREVFGLVLAYTIYYICRHPNAQALLREELKTASMSALTMTLGEDGCGGLPSPTDLEQLPYLTAVIKESLRMRPNSTPLPRETPQGKTVTICGVDGIPPGTRVNCFQWFLHRDEAQWDNPHEWEPKRWLDSGSKGGPFWPFVSGPRICIGNNLTYYLFRYILVTIFTNFSGRPVSVEEYGKHKPGSPEDLLHVQMVPLKPE